MTMEPDKIKFIDYKPIKYSWDLLITNITSTLVLIIYTFFVLIQITYLFTGIGTLPAGLTYAEYARRGFFQLLILSIINIVMIFAIINLTRNATGKWAKYKTVILAYSCFVTAVLLASSFYRMWLYIDFYGMTRLRFLVISFLCFEILGLIATVRYVMRPTFNIVGVYVCIMLAFYTFVNLAPMDAIIAKNQVDRYIADESGDIYYVTTLSNDVVPQLSRLLEYENSFEDNPWSARDEDTAWLVRDFITRANNNKLPPLWQRWHLYDILSSNID
ncbi:MAG: DUF4173 domain-containing protein [Clostridiales bacterium]|nr:DUF4173 domain-containing protein [Clostridiales bacterium]